MGEGMKYFAVIALALFAVAAYAMTAGKKALEKALDSVTGYEELFRRYTTKNNVPFLRCIAIAMQESSLRPLGTHPDGLSTGIMGVTQVALNDVNRNFSRSFVLGDMFNVEKCVDAGTLYFKICQDALGGNIDKATQAYNAGWPRVRSNPSAGLEYLGLVLRREEELKDKAGF
jgi:soluble lytic murein transglycosylase-like protein